jgi:DNA invertase Pin-like site-specific DNA recombinase
MSVLGSWHVPMVAGLRQKKRGVKFRPKPKLAPHQEKEAVRMVHAQGQSLRAVAHHYHVGHSTIVRALERATATASLAGR